MVINVYTITNVNPIILEIIIGLILTSNTFVSLGKAKTNSSSNCITRIV